MQKTNEHKNIVPCYAVKTATHDVFCIRTKIQEKPVPRPAEWAFSISGKKLQLPKYDKPIIGHKFTCFGTYGRAKRVYRVARTFFEQYYWRELAGVFAYLVARRKSSGRSGYFTLKDLKGTPHATSYATIIRQVNMAIALGLIEKKSRGVYHFISIRRVTKRGKGHVFLSDKAFKSLSTFKSALVAAECTFIIEGQHRMKDKLARMKPLDRAKLIRKLLQQADGEHEKKWSCSATRSAMQEFEGECKTLPRAISKFCYQHLNKDKPNAGYVALSSLSRRFGISISTASRMRLSASKMKFIDLELMYQPITAWEAEYAPYLEKYRIYQVGGQYRYRMTSKVVSHVKIDRVRCNVKK
jgi:hypothetical protein